MPSEANLYLLLRLIGYAVVFSDQLLLETTPVGTCNSERFASAYISDTVYAYEGRGDWIVDCFLIFKRKLPTGLSEVLQALAPAKAK